MADKNYVVSLTVDDSGAVAAVNNMTTALDRADGSTKSLKAQLREMQAQLANLDVNSEEFERLSRSAGKLKDQINDAAEAVRANAGNAFESLSNNSAVLRQRLFDLDFEGAGQSVKALAVSAKNLTFKEATAGIKGLTSGLGDLAKAILTNPILLLGSVIVGVIANFESLTKVGGAVGSFFSGIATFVEDLKQGLMDFTDTLGLTDFAAQEYAENQKKREEAAKKSLQDYANSYEADVEEKKRKFIKDADGNLKNALTNFKTYVDQTTTENQRLIDQYDQLKANGRAIDSYTEERVKIAINENKALSKSYNDLDKELKDQQQEQNTRAKKLREDKAKERQKEIQERREAALELMLLEDKLNQGIETSAQETINRVTDRLKSFADKIKIEAPELFGSVEDQEKLYKELADSRKSAEELELQDLENKYKEQRALAGNDAELRKQLLDKYLLDENGIKEKYSQLDKDRERAARDAKIQYAVDGIAAIGNIIDAFSNKSKKNARANFNREKAFGIATATMNTYLAATAALAMKPSQELFPGQRFVQMGLALVAGFAQVAKISRSKFSEGGGGDSGGGGGVPGVSGANGGGSQSTVPTFNALNLDVLKMRPEQTPKAYVLAQDVSTAVEARDKVRDLARIN
jgi:hypothetical protein